MVSGNIAAVDADWHRISTLVWRQPHKHIVVIFSIVSDQRALFVSFVVCE